MWSSNLCRSLRDQKNISTPWVFNEVSFLTLHYSHYRVKKIFQTSHELLSTEAKLSIRSRLVTTSFDLCLARATLGEFERYLSLGSSSWLNLTKNFELEASFAYNNLIKSYEDFGLTSDFANYEEFRAWRISVNIFGRTYEEWFFGYQNFG